MTTAYDFLWSLDQRDKGGKLRLGQAVVRSVDGDPVFGTVTGQAMIVPASADWINAEALPAKYLSEYPPRPGAGVWYATDGNDVLILGMMAPEGPPVARLQVTAATAIVTSTNTTLTFGSVLTDPWEMNSGSTALRAPVAGIYDISAWAAWASNATGNRRADILINGVGPKFYARSMAANGIGNAHVTNLVWPLAQGDLVTMRVFQNSGADLNLNDAILSMTYVGRTRSTATSNVLLRQSFPVDDPGWLFTNSPTSGFSNTNGTPTLSIQPTVASALTVGYSPETFAVVPRRRYELTARVSTSLASGTGTGPSQYLNMVLVCAANGVPDPTLATSSTVTAPTVYAAGTGTSQYNFGTVQIPDNVYTARLGLQVYPTTSLKVGFFTNIAITEVVS